MGDRTSYVVTVPCKSEPTAEFIKSIECVFDGLDEHDFHPERNEWVGNVFECSVGLEDYAGEIEEALAEHKMPPYFTVMEEGFYEFGPRVYEVNEAGTICKPCDDDGTPMYSPSEVLQAAQRGGLAAVIALVDPSGRHKKALDARASRKTCGSAA